MNAINRYYTKRERTNFYLNVIVLTIFIGYSISLMFEQSEFIGVVFFLIILVFFAGSMILKETLNFFFQKAIYQLTFECDPITAQQTINIVKKWDIFKGYNVPYVAFSSLVYIDTENAQAILDLFSEGNKLTKIGKDMILIKNYSLYKAFVILNNKTQIKKAYADLIKLKDFTHKGKKLSPLYAWFDIEAEYALLTNDSKEAFSILSKANTKALNLREQAHHLFLYANVETERGNITEALTHYETVIKIANKMVIKDKAQKRSEELKHEKTQKTRR
jgi:tetratricopeptide (TPR) repeat protein